MLKQELKKLYGIRNWHLHKTKNFESSMISTTPCFLLQTIDKLISFNEIAFAQLAN